jgi:hypothetical protein
MAAPHGVTPPSFPVFSKPVYNLQGMGWQSRIIASSRDYEEMMNPGHFWMELLRGPHISTDIAVHKGRPVWFRHTKGWPIPAGMFDYWEMFLEGDLTLESYVGPWIEERLPGYTGFVNVETIGGRIIEAQLRFANQWIDLNGPGWLEAAVNLYAGKGWSFDGDKAQKGYSVVLFAPPDARYKYPPPELQREIRAMPGISSLQVSFYEEFPGSMHSMPPGGLRLAVINCFDLEAGMAAREMLKKWFFNK